ncbi:GNAT family N-acetyltransferase [Candidatus Gottesmanbacteria bacterium]|nr:GNAT family N-acetyltransferase [Candidatus Gottesmanbacteria bacterium]
MFTVEKAKVEQVNEIKALLKHTWINTYHSYFSAETIEVVTSTWHDPELLKQQIQNPKVYFAVAKDENEKIVGIITARRIENNETLQLDRLYILPSHQNKGIGKMLFNKTLVEFKGIKTVFVDIEEMNQKAIEFYRKQGFEDYDSSVEKIGDKTFKVKKMIKRL